MKPKKPSIPASTPAATDSVSPVTFERRGAVAVIRLDRPDKHNAVNGAIVARLEAISRELEVMASGDGASGDDASAKEAVRAVVLHGAGEKTFCAGGDLAYFSRLEGEDAGEAMSRRMQATLSRLTGGPRPVIAALGGDVLGGGCELAAACHLRIAAEGIRFAFRPAALGAFTGWGGGRRLFRLVGRGAALRLLLGAETIDAAEALRLGLVDRVVPKERLFAEALAWAERIAANDPASVAAFLELDRSIHRDTPEEVAEVETRLFDELWRGETFQELLAEWRRKSA